MVYKDDDADQAVFGGPEGKPAFFLERRVIFIVLGKNVGVLENGKDLLKGKPMFFAPLRLRARSFPSYLRSSASSSEAGGGILFLGIEPPRAQRSRRDLSGLYWDESMRTDVVKAILGGNR